MDKIKQGMKMMKVTKVTLKVGFWVLFFSFFLYFWEKKWQDFKNNNWKKRERDKKKKKSFFFFKYCNINKDCEGKKNIYVCMI